MTEKLQLDRNRPFGEVYGSSDHKYEQDGMNFDANGDALEDPPVPALVPVDDLQAGTFENIGVGVLAGPRGRRGR